MYYSLWKFICIYSFYFFFFFLQLNRISYEILMNSSKLRPSLKHGLCCLAMLCAFLCTSPLKPVKTWKLILPLSHTMRISIFYFILSFFYFFGQTSQLCPDFKNIDLHGIHLCLETHFNWHICCIMPLWHNRLMSIRVHIRKMTLNYTIESLMVTKMKQN